ncbi:MAG: GNAT family N-acetyltransferase [Alphaproteobacteria bacterium]|nr:GNAT family N-acetyltransferase [Alphaproteobacteria bacterium]MBV9700810.1 GNAT family N-acetyltransferase [Candidatus Eremiobacteraeota bacterium]
MTSFSGDEFEVSADPARLDLDAVERFLRKSYWAGNRQREVIERSIRHSRCFGIYEGTTGRQVGFARAVTDFATFVWLCDVVIHEAYRGHGLGKRLMECVFADPELARIRRWILATRDAHVLYERYGFAPFAHPECWMERVTDEKGSSGSS